MSKLITKKKSKKKPKLNRYKFGVGYNSKGKHHMAGNNLSLCLQNCWGKLLGGCYSDKYKAKGVTAKEEWQDFQVFAEWCHTSKVVTDLTHEDSHSFIIDKTILYNGASELSEDNVCIVPKELAMVFHNPHANKVRALPTGVSKRGSRYFAQISQYGNKVGLGTFDNPEEAGKAYASSKQRYIQDLANKYETVLDGRVYEALMNWTAKN